MLHVRALVVRLLPAVCLCLLWVPAASLGQAPQPDRAHFLKQLVVEGTTVFTAEDVRWLLDLREGAPLPASPERVAAMLQQRYEREGYTAAEVDAAYAPDSGTLHLRVDEGRIDAIEIHGVNPDAAERYRTALRVRPGDVFNQRIVRRDVDRILAETNGAVHVGRAPPDRGTRGAADIELIERDGRRVLMIPLRERSGRFRVATGSAGREDLFSPVDGFTPALEFQGAVFDDDPRNYTLFTGFASYKFGADRPGYSLGVERSLGAPMRWYVGADVHDITDSDDRWRLSAVEQSLVALAFKNTFRDYYRRRGIQVHSALRSGAHHEVSAAWRRDRHEPLTNATNYSFFRDDREFRANAEVLPGDVRSLVLGYSYDSRGLEATSIAAAYQRHLADDLFRGVRSQQFGWRADWTTEIAGHGFGGDREYRRHILNARAYVPLAPRQVVGGRIMLGDSDGPLPVERRFALGGVGTVHGYKFKEVAGERMALMNVEYRLDLSGDASTESSRSGLAALFFYDAGRVGRPISGSHSSWLHGIGVGLEVAFIRVEIGFRVSDIPDSRQILVRLTPPF